MQQTNKYKLNKPGLDDPVAIAPLNENMDKLEAALIAEAKSRADADADESSARTAAIQAEAAARVSAVNAEISARTAAVNAEASTRANADTTETNARVAADKAEAKTRADADTAETNARIAAVNAEATARANADNALSQRVTVLEGKHVMVMTYTGDGVNNRIIRPGFTPTGIVYCAPNNGLVRFLTPQTQSANATTPIFVDGGVMLPNSDTSFLFNTKGKLYGMLLIN